MQLNIKKQGSYYTALLFLNVMIILPYDAITYILYHIFLLKSTGKLDFLPWIDQIRIFDIVYLHQI